MNDHPGKTEDGSRRRRRSQAELMDLLLRAAAEEFQARGYNGATTAAIAREANVTEAQLYRYFPTKAELFKAAVFQPLNDHFCNFHNRYLAEVGERTNKREQARRYISELQEFLTQQAPMLMSLIAAEAYAPDKVQGVGEFDALEAYFERGAAMMSTHTGDEAPVDPKLMVRVAFAAVLANAMFADWLYPEGLASDKAIESALIDFVIDGIRANPDPGLDGSNSDD